MDLTVLYIIAIALVVFVVVITGFVTTSKRRMMRKRMADLKAEQRVMGNDFVPKQKSSAMEQLLNEKISANEYFSRLFEALKSELEALGLGDKTAVFLIGWAALIVVAPIVASLLNLYFLFEVGVALVAVFAPLFYISIKKKQRTKAISRQLENAIGIIINAMRAGYSFQAALHAVGTEMDPPISEEFERVFRETSYGKDMSVALQGMAQRTNSEDVQLLETAYSVQASVGGDMGQILRTIANTIALRHRLEEEIKAKTASGRLSGILVAAIPVVLMVLINILNPGYIDFFFTTELGKKILAGTLMLEIVGIILIKNITTMKY